MHTMNDVRRLHDLTVQSLHVEAESCMSVLFYLLCLFALVIGVEDKATVLQSFEQNVSGRWFPIFSTGGQDHGVRHSDNAKILVLFKPEVELLDWIGMELGFVDAFVLVGLPHSL